MDRVVRTGVSIEPGSLEEFDRVTAVEDCGSRSEDIRDLIREKLVRTAWRSGKREVMSTVAGIQSPFRWGHGEVDEGKNR